MSDGAAILADLQRLQDLVLILPLRVAVTQAIGELRALLAARPPDLVEQALGIVDRLLDTAAAFGVGATEEPVPTLHHLRGLLAALPVPLPASLQATTVLPLAGSNLSHVPEWVDKVADAISYLLIAWGIMIAGSWAGYDNWIVALAMTAALTTLFPNLVGPFRQFIKSIVLEILQTIIDLVEAVGHFFEAAGRYYNGNFARMVIELVLVPVFLRALRDLIGYPAVRELIDSILGVIEAVRDLLSQGIAAAEQLVVQVRDSLTQDLRDLLAFIPAELGRWRDLLVTDFTRLFNVALGRLDALDARLDRALADLVRYVDVTIAGVTVKLDLLDTGLHDRITALIDSTAGEVARRYALYRVAHALAENFTALGQALAESGNPDPPPAVEAAAPWVVLAGLLGELPASPPAVASPAYDAVQEAVTDLEAFLAGAPNPIGPWPLELSQLPPGT